MKATFTKTVELMVRGFFNKWNVYLLMFDSGKFITQKWFVMWNVEI